MAENGKKDEKKIIIDEDWKQQAKKEKEVMAAKEEAEKPQSQNEEGRGPLPEGDFAALVSMLFTQTLFSLGFIQVKGQEKRAPDLALARYNIDMLETLEAKTKGNLNDEEQQAITSALNELRMVYVKVASQQPEN
jgi:GH24 family phage-related lysozyme (muramidase)